MPAQVQTAHRGDGYQRGGYGAVTLADAVSATDPATPTLLYSTDLSTLDKLEVVARELYGAVGVELSTTAAAKLARFAELDAATLPVCVAKTPYSLSGDPARKGAPTGHMLEISDVRLCAGAGFIYALTSKVLTMPGMSANPLASRIDVDASGAVTGLS